MTRFRQLMCRDDGTASIELVIAVPMILLCLGFAVMVGRIATIDQDVTSAARDAARAASVRQFPAAAQADALAAVNETLTARSVSCAGLTVLVDTSQLEPGGQVEATVTCEVSLADVSGWGLPGSRTITASSISIVDEYRGGS